MDVMAKKWRKKAYQSGEMASMKIWRISISMAIMAYQQWRSASVVAINESGVEK
jgi:hypothetical protein